MKVVAEGAETEPQLGFLARHGCNVAQGYLFAQFPPAREIRGWLAVPPPHAPRARCATRTRCTDHSALTDSTPDPAKTRPWNALGAAGPNTPGPKEVGARAGTETGELVQGCPDLPALMSW